MAEVYNCPAIVPFKKTYLARGYTLFPVGWKGQDLLIATAVPPRFGYRGSAKGPLIVEVNGQLRE